MDRQSELSIVRAAYAKQVLAAARVASDARLEATLGAIRREDFLGPGPWPIMRWFRDYVTTPDTDPVYLYTDDLVGILPERRINNGQPSWHAHLIHQAAPAAGNPTTWVLLICATRSRLPGALSHECSRHRSSALLLMIFI